MVERLTDIFVPSTVKFKNIYHVSNSVVDSPQEVKDYSVQPVFEDPRSTEKHTSWSVGQSDMGTLELVPKPDHSIHPLKEWKTKHWEWLNIAQPGSQNLYIYIWRRGAQCQFIMYFVVIFTHLHCTFEFETASIYYYCVDNANNQLRLWRKKILQNSKLYYLFCCINTVPITLFKKQGPQ